MNLLLDAISRISSVMNRKRFDYDRRLAEVLTIILDYLGAEQGSIMVREKKHLVVRAATRREIIGHRQPLGSNSIASFVEKSGEPLLIKNIQHDARFKGLAPGIYRESELLSVPIQLDDQVVGVINVTDKKGDHRILPDDIACLLQFGSLIVSLLGQQQLQAELKRQKNALRRKNQELKRQEQLRAELSRMLVHDLKGPLSEIVANLDILSYTQPEAGKEFLEAAQTSCERAVRMVSNLVTVGKIEDGDITLLKEKVAPQVLVEESLSSIKGLARLKGVQLYSEPCEGLPDVEADRVLILRVLQNLLNNALGCSRSGQTISVSCKLGENGRLVEFFVADQGIGIPKDKQEVIFDKYASLRCEESNVVGTGLGLYFCRLAVEKHGGAIWVESVVRRGSRFTFTLPL